VGPGIFLGAAGAWPSVFRRRYAGRIDFAANKRRLALALTLALGEVLGCAPACAPTAVPGTQVQMSFGAQGFYSAPFPSEHRRSANGHVDLASFPNPDAIDFVEQLRGLIVHDADGFGLSSAIYFSLTGAVDPSSLPDIHSSTALDAPVFLTSVDEASPDHGRRHPIAVHFAADGGPFGAPNLLALLPVQGIPLRPATTYAAVVRRSLRDAAGAPLGVSLDAAKLLGGEVPAGMSEAVHQIYERALSDLESAGIARRTIAGIAVFRTGNPTAELDRLRADALDAGLPSLDAPPSFAEQYDGFCVFRSTIRMPDYQEGTPPYATRGGGIAFTSAGRPVRREPQTASVWITIPRAPMPDRGYPVAVFVRTGGGGDRPLVDRGVQRMPGGPPIRPGSGPAEEFAKVGWAAVSVDGPLGGLRNPDHADEQFLIFNLLNPVAMRDNLRQSALELSLLPGILDRVGIDAGACAEAGSATVRFDTRRIALMGHSMGATIAPLVLAIEPRYGAAILSGAGGSWIENVIHKTKPVPVKTAAEDLLRYDGDKHRLDEFDPVLTLLQWAGEPADPPLYAPRIVSEPTTVPRHVLMFQGVVDHYIQPPIANAMSLALGLDLGGKALEASLPGLLDLVGRRQVALPAVRNLEGATGVVVQHAEDGVEDGHEVVFQSAAPKRQYRCFLRTLLDGAPAVPSADGECQR
jgi:hypothetical protein